MMIDPRMIDRMVNNYHQGLKKDHEIFRRYGLPRYFAARKPSYFSKWIDILADVLIRLGQRLKRRAAYPDTVCRSDCV